MDLPAFMEEFSENVSSIIYGAASTKSIEMCQEAVLYHLIDAWPRTVHFVLPEICIIYLFIHLFCWKYLVNDQSFKRQFKGVLLTWSATAQWTKAE